MEHRGSKAKLASSLSPVPQKPGMQTSKDRYSHSLEEKITTAVSAESEMSYCQGLVPTPSLKRMSAWFQMHLLLIGLSPWMLKVRGPRVQVY